MPNSKDCNVLLLICFDSSADKSKTFAVAVILSAQTNVFMLRLEYITWVWFALITGSKVFTQTVSSNVSAIIIHRQYYDNHLVFIHFKNIRHGRGPFKIAVEYRCTLGAPIEPYCVADWQQIPGCHVTSVENEVFYSCLILRNKVLLLYQYEIKAAVKLPLGWRNQTSNFTVKVSSVSEPLEGLSATAVDYETVMLSWKRVKLMRDLQNFKTEDIDMVMKVVRRYENQSKSEKLRLKPTLNSTILHGFKSSRNYSLVASYHFIVSGINLSWSGPTGQVNVWIPEKVRVSEPATNQSCEEISNGTSTFINFTWMVPLSKRNVGRVLEVKLTIEYPGVQVPRSVSQRPGTRGSFILSQKPHSDVKVKIVICNEAGCSSISTYTCRYKKSGGEDGKGEHMSDTVIWEYGVGVCIAVLVTLGIVFFLYRHYQKRNLANRMDKNDRTLEVVPPRLQNSYDEPCFVVSHDYDDFPLHDVMENAQVGNGLQ